MTEVAEVKHRSASQLLSYSQCGEAYRLERVVKAPSRPAGWFMHGTAVHAAVEAWENSGRSMAQDELHALFLTQYRTEVNAELERTDLKLWMTGGNKKTETDLEDRENTGWWQVQDYQRLAREEHELWEVVESEFEFHITIGDVPVRGFIDQIVRNKITGKYTSHDLKTGANMPPAPVQLAIYRDALRASVDGIDPSMVADVAYWVHLGRPQSASGRTKEKPSKLVEENLEGWPTERVGRWLYDMDQSERNGIYLPSPTNGCDRVCGVAQWCRAVGSHYPSVQQYAGGLLDQAYEVRMKEEPE